LGREKSNDQTYVDPNNSNIVIEIEPVVFGMQNVFSHEEGVTAAESTGRAAPEVDLRRKILVKSSQEKFR
jgi:hypothetical protein